LQPFKEFPTGLEPSAMSKNQDTGTRMGNNDLKISAVGEQGAQSGNGRKVLARFDHLPANREGVLKEEMFHAMLTRERRRAERSRKPFVLILLSSHSQHMNGSNATFIGRLPSAISDAIRETDIVGWYEDGAILGVIFTEINLAGASPITEVLRSKIVAALRDNLNHKIASKLVITVHVFPESWDKNRPDEVADLKLYPDLSHQRSRKRIPIVIKRVIDIIGSGLLLLFVSPVLAAIALLIKLTSDGAVIFEQERVGQFGKHFKCLKFRTMYVNNDSKIHRDYVYRLIAGKSKEQTKDEAAPVVYKITNDPRITPIGRFLRKTSLDEFPQFWNVLRGEMSLVGPRPPLPYEFEVYDFWHRRRVLEVRPGVTGLWQVNGRSRTCFDDMVRLDLRYSQSWSLWLDLRILLATPRAVFTGDGAY
jgi:lipopolysaccharide/colanic/teichoic acid biosynthesis glycosyltransferase